MLTARRAKGRRPQASRITSASGAGAVWQRARFGTVRPRVQIPGPRPLSEYDPGVTARAAMAMDNSWITIFQIFTKLSLLS